MKKVIYNNHTLYDAWDHLYQFLPEDNGFTNLGSGSDYTAFLQLGIGALDFGFDADRNTPVYHYHSNYDSYHWMKTRIDPDFSIHATAGQFITLLAYHLADDALIPFDIDTYARNINYYVRDLVAETLTMGTDYGALQRKIAVPDLDTAAKKFRTIAQSFAESTSQKDFLTDAKKVQDVNRRLRDMQRIFVKKEGLQGRPFYKNALWAPSREDGYKAQMLPGSMEALREGDWERCREWNLWLAGAIDEAAKMLSLE
jgi:N-acetylated-alpha-linked acidic dipeptidase